MHVWQKMTEIADDAENSNKTSQGYGKRPKVPSCDTCPNKKRQLVTHHRNGTYHREDKDMCCWGGFPRFILDYYPKEYICKHHPDYGKPWPPEKASE